MSGDVPAAAKRVRRRVVIAVLCCVVAVAGGIGARLHYLERRTPARGYAQDFDANIADTQPLLWPAVKANPVLRQLMLERTQVAFLRGGWPAASSVFARIIHARMQAFAGDDATLACHAAWQDLRRTLLPTNPHACALMETQGPKVVPRGVATAAIEREIRVCTDAAVEGGESRSLPNPPARATWAEHQKLESLTPASPRPRPLPADELAALARPQDADDASLCRARIDQGDNLAAQRSDLAARDIRFDYASEEGTGFDPPRVATVPANVDPPANLTCAPPGMVFTLSMYGGNGRPITWTSLGRRGWDCALRSSASGVRGTWTNLRGESNNALRLLWPLMVGKSAEFLRDHDVGGNFQVGSYDRYWLPFGWVQAYAIEEDVSAWNGDLLYSVTRYWSPELGFVIGQRTKVVRGDWPENVAPDWQVVAKDGGAG